MRKWKRVSTIGHKIGRKLAAIVILTSVVFGSFSTTGIVKAAEDEKVGAAQYYHKVEVLSQESFIDSYTGLYGAVINKYQEQIKNGYGQLMSLKGEFAKEFADSLGLSGVENMEVKVDAMGKDISGRANYKFFLNNKQLLDGEGYVDGEKGLVYVRIPDLSKAYLKTSLEDIYNNDYMDYAEKMFISNNPFTEQVLNSLLKKYSKIITEELKDVTLQKDVEVSANGVVGKVNELTVHVTTTDFYNICKAVLKAASTDQTLAFLCEKLGYCTQEEYVKNVKILLAEFEEELLEMDLQREEYAEFYEENWDNLIDMKVWVDVNGKIVGRKFFMSEYEEESFGYLSMADGSRTGFEAWSADEDGDYFRMKAEGIKDASSNYTGKAVINLTDSYEEKTNTYTIDIKNANFSYLEDGYIDGTFTFTSNQAKNDSYRLSFVGSPNWQNIKYNMVQNGVSQLALEVDAKDVLFTGLYLPSDAEQIFDGETELESFMETADIEGFIKRIEDQIDNSELKAKWSQMIKGVFYEEFSE